MSTRADYPTLIDPVAAPEARRKAEWALLRTWDPSRYSGAPEGRPRSPGALDDPRTGRGHYDVVRSMAQAQPHSPDQAVQWAEFAAWREEVGRRRERNRSLLLELLWHARIIQSWWGLDVGEEERVLLRALAPEVAAALARFGVSQVPPSWREVLALARGWDWSPRGAR